MAPPWVTSPEAYQAWLDKVVSESGGWLEGSALIVGLLPHEELEDHFIGLQVPRQRLLFASSVLEMRLTVNEDLEEVEYNYHFQEIVEGSPRMVWRIDRHPGHEDEVGGLEHIHRHPDQPRKVEPYPSVDLGEALELVHSFHETGSRP